MYLHQTQILNERRIAQYPMDIVTLLLQLAAIVWASYILVNSFTKLTNALTTWTAAIARLVSVLKQFFTRNKKGCTLYPVDEYLVVSY
ncbi:hypothetical protein [Lactobacillus sp. ESL0681]|uniref:hypothetical protein n=1 Tax=Lactobacillus sp. ESL0681 TaxID=2983211 RepID=UPI0023F8CCDF|nr:hypothetical protein [Lactobacillus sp. ESL0681]WEV40110.1 hypothetical protein OZX59_07845 [Lactobacillus sp. ESL0681]